MTDFVIQAEETYSRLVEHLPIGLYQLSPEGRFLWTNPALARMLHLSEADEVLQHHLARFYARSEDLDRRQELLETQDVLHSFVVQLKRPNGSVLWAQDNCRAIRNEAGMITSYEGSLEDITERHQLEEMLFQSQKLEALGRMAGTVAHDFNNMLTAILGFSHSALESLDDTSPVWDDLQEIVNAGNKAASLTSQLLTFSRRQRTRMEPLGLNEMLASSEAMLRKTLGPGHLLNLRPAPSLPDIIGDRSQMEQVILNLVVNARDAMASHGTITVRTSQAECGEHFCRAHPNLAVGSHVCLCVTDEGCGMTDEVRQHIFEPFFTTKERGTGLGLPTVYSIIRHMRGSIEVETAPLMGTTMRLYIPVAPGFAAPSKPSPSNTTGSLRLLPRGHEHILVVEDEETVRNLSQRLLHTLGYSVTVAADGLEAWGLLNRLSRPFDLVITDIVMPRMSGLELVEKIRAENRPEKILFISGYSDRQLTRNKKGESDSLLLKPFTRATLAHKVREVLDVKV
jgi:two-component system cell cycle sensor histidine kinase/response regulator CckA